MKRRRIGRTAFMLIGVCVTLWRLPATIEAFAGTLGSGGTAKDSILSAMSVAAGLSSKDAGKPGAKFEPTLITAGGKNLSEAERERLLRQARAMAPLPLDGAKDAKKGSQSPEDAAAEIQRQIDDVLKHGVPNK